MAPKLICQRLLLVLVAVALCSSCLSTARHAECKQGFDLCSDTCAAKCEDGPSTTIAPNLAEAMPSTDASAACAQCVDRCIERRDKCDDEVDARLASQPE